MAQQILLTPKLYAAEFDITSFCNSVALPMTPDKHEVTVFGGGRAYMPGLQSGGFTISGFTEFGAGKIEKIMRTLRGQIDKPVTCVPQGATVANPAVFMSASFSGYEFGGPHGNPNAFSWNGGTSKWQSLRGFLEEPGITPRTTTGNSTNQQLGAVAANQFLYAAVHVISATGTMDLIVESDNAAGFTTPVTVLTFPQFTAVGSSIMRVAGPFVDDFFRFKWTLASSPSFTFVAVFAVGS